MDADYGNWVSKRLIVLPLLAGAVLLGVAVFLPVLFLLSIVLFLISGYFLYSRYQFGSGGNVQMKIVDLVVEKLDWSGSGKAVDIGCGNGALAIRLARKHPSALVIGVDTWGSRWEYSKEACERNGVAEGVGERVTFQKASASALPFGEGYFDAAVSNLVFHEARDAKDKREAVKEALRVVKKGGRFAFQDLFLVEREYGSIDEFIRTIQSWGVSRVEFAPTRDSPFIPRLLKLPFMVGTMGIVSGEK